MPKSLSGMRILVTRPEHQAVQQTAMLRKLGADPVRLPLLAIEPYAEHSPEFQHIKSRILDLDLYHSVIFISPNAARIGADWIDQYWPQLPIGVNWLAIGQRTTDMLADYGITAFSSDQGYDSEALLQISALSNVKNEKILILRGCGGRDHLANNLEQRGAQVDYANLYQRGCPTYNAAELAAALDQIPDALLVTSGEALSNLHQIAADYLAKLQQQLLIVPSERIASQAAQQHWQRVRVASGPDDHAMIQALTV